jgi:C1A family cysteine protease
VCTSALARTLEDGHIPLPKRNEEPVASHTLFVSGYVERDNAAGGGYLICKGSQGSRRGERGYFLVPFAYTELHKERGSVSDAWTSLGLAD